MLTLGGRNAKGALEALRRNKSELRRQVAKGLTLKFAPDLKFQIDETFDRMDDTRRMLSEDRVRRDVEG